MHMNRTTQFRSLIVGACLATGLLITSVAQAHVDACSEGMMRRGA